MDTKPNSAIGFGPVDQGSNCSNALKVPAGSFIPMDYYTTIAESYETLYKEEQLNKLQLIKDHLQLTGKELILDIGCGPCWSSALFNNVVGIDPAFGLLDKAKAVALGKAEQLPFKDNSFDIILCITAVHHFALDNAFEEMKRVAADDAAYIITVLKKSTEKWRIMEKIKEHFTITTVVEEEKDVIMFLSNPSSSV